MLDLKMVCIAIALWMVEKGHVVKKMTPMCKIFLFGVGCFLKAAFAGDRYVI